VLLNTNLLKRHQLGGIARLVKGLPSHDALCLEAEIHGPPPVVVIPNQTVPVLCCIVRDLAGWAPQRDLISRVKLVQRSLVSNKRYISQDAVRYGISLEPTQTSPQHLITSGRHVLCRGLEPTEQVVDIRAEQQVKVLDECEQRLGCHPQAFGSVQARGHVGAILLRTSTVTS
jgi:hypothetical protein